MTEELEDGFADLGVEVGEDTAPFRVTAREKWFGGVLGLAGLAAAVLIGPAIVVGVAALYQFLPFLLLGLGAN